MFTPRRWQAIVVLILVGCIPSPRPSPTTPEEPPVELTQAIQPSDTQVVEPTTEPLDTGAHAVPDARIRIATTSDWTEFRMVKGAILDDTEILSSSSEASTATIDQDRFVLIQPISQAEAGGLVELVAELFFTEDSMRENLEFEIDRGHIGATTVEIYSYACGHPTLVDTFIWEENQPFGENIQSFSIPATQLSAPSQNEYTVIAQLNFWYYGPGLYGGFENDLGERSTPLTPLLGETYWASDPEVVHQQIEWASEYGVDAFSIEWTTPRGVGCCGSMEDTLDDVFLKSPNIHKVRWVIFYDFVLRLNQTAGLEQYVGALNFNEPAVFDTFVADFIHFAQKYFDHPQYLTIDDRPVIYIWATNAFVGDLEGAMREAREEVTKLGFDVFIVGDEMRTDLFDPDHVSLFDGSTTFTFLIPGIDWYSLDDVGEASVAVDNAFQWWTTRQTGLQVAGREEMVNFQPAWAPQYDERNIIFDRPKYVPALSQDQVRTMAEVARKYAQPVGSQEEMFIWLNTWNNWAETATVEPTANLGPKYPAGNYQFDMLEVVREVFGPETSSCEIP